ncbi:hypothetical protein FQA39_LY06134 [Lamprigera yunnana]|nr:hypothetical protein FQA39_LY06134 [Lamprigera yunnana]
MSFVDINIHIGDHSSERMQEYLHISGTKRTNMRDYKTNKVAAHFEEHRYFNKPETQESISHTQIVNVDVNENDDWDAVRVKLPDAVRFDNFISIDNDVISITSETMDMNEIITNHTVNLQEDGDEEKVEAVDNPNPSHNEAPAAVFYDL